MEQRLNKLLELSKEADVETLTKEVIEAINSVKEYSSSFWKNFMLEGFYRARVHKLLDGNDIEKPFLIESEVWNAPNDYCTLGRCNEDGESLLYCSNEFETSIMEVKPSEGDFVTVTSFDYKGDYEGQEAYTGIRINPIGLQYLSQIESLKEAFKNYNPDKPNDFKQLDDFLDKLFHNDVDENNQHLYKLSVAVTKCMLKNVLLGGKEHEMQGLLYPSILRDKKSFNFVLKPLPARYKYGVKAIQTFRVVDETKQSLQLQLLRTGNIVGKPLEPFGFREIEWSPLIEDGERVTVDKYKLK